MVGETELVDKFGAAALRGAAAIFVGAGLSIDAGYPKWKDLIAELRDKAGIPDEIADLPLVAEYYVQETPGGRSALEDYLLSQLSGVDPEVQPNHHMIARLPVTELWTTNYDPLLEMAVENADVFYSDEGIRKGPSGKAKTIIKMHGSLDRDGNAWVPGSRPVITRSDYDAFESRHPYISTALRATYLTKSILFVGFSFDDPNVEVLLRLSRSLSGGSDAEAPNHFTILRRPRTEPERREFELRKRDLEQTGIGVLEVEEYDEIEGFLRRLVRRTRRARVYIGGSPPEDPDEVVDRFYKVGHQMGVQFASHEVVLVSLAGKAAMLASYGMGEILRAEDRYQPDRCLFYFRSKDEKPERLEERLGTAIYSEYGMEALREETIDESRVAVFLGGGSRSKDEIAVARSFGVPLVPIATTGGTARDTWETSSSEECLQLDHASPEITRDWYLLNDSDVDVAARAAKRLAMRAMYLRSDCASV